MEFTFRLVRKADYTENEGDDINIVARAYYEEWSNSYVFRYQNGVEFKIPGMQTESEALQNGTLASINSPNGSCPLEFISMSDGYTFEYAGEDYLLDMTSIEELYEDVDSYSEDDEW